MSSPRNVMVLVALLAGCNPVWRHGVELAKDGRFDLACTHWLEVLEDDEFDPAARRGLERYGADAHRLRLDEARELEAEGRYEASVAAYEGLLAFEADLRDLEVLAFEPEPGIPEELEDARASLAKQQFAAGTAAIDAGDFAAGIEALKTAQRVGPELASVDERVAAAWFAWGKADLDATQYFDAIAHFDTAFAAGHPDARAWSAETSAALGRYYLQHGGCRQAVDALEAADRSINDPQVDQDLAAAKDCARIELLVYPFEQSVEAPLKGTDLGTLASDRLAEALGAAASRHVRLLEPTAALETTPPAAGRRFLVRGRITQLDLHRESIEKTGSAPGKRRELCPGLDGYYADDDQWCDQDVTVTWKERGGSVGLRIGGSVRAVEVGPATQLLNRTLYLDAEHRSVTGSDFQVAGVPVTLAAEPATGVIAVAPEVIALTTPTPLPGDLDLVSDAASRFADDAAKALLDAVDTESQVGPPRRLDVRAPILRPSDIQLKPGQMMSQPAPSSEPAPAAEPAPPAEPAPAAEPAP